MIINFVTEFLYQSLIVFRKTMNTNAVARRDELKKEALAAAREE